MPAYYDLFVYLRVIRKLVSLSIRPFDTDDPFSLFHCLFDVVSQTFDVDLNSAQAMSVH